VRKETNILPRDTMIRQKNNEFQVDTVKLFSKDLSEGVKIFVSTGIGLVPFCHFFFVQFC
jgi:predicted membrane protein